MLQKLPIKSKPSVRLFVEGSLVTAVEMELADNQHHYLNHVLRKNVADEVLVFNGRDGEWRAQISAMNKKSAHIQIIEQTRKQRPQPDITLCFAPIKSRALDFMIEKTTELGVATFQPVITARTNVERVNIDRIRFNAIEAAEQSERLSVPEVLPAKPFEKLLNEWQTSMPLVFCDETGGGRPVRDVLSSHMEEVKSSWGLLIGPEGGFDPLETERISSQPFSLPVGLGPRILRADTAAIVALAAWQMFLGDFHEAPSFKGTLV